MYVVTLLWSIYATCFKCVVYVVYLNYKIYSNLKTAVMLVSAKTRGCSLYCLYYAPACDPHSTSYVLLILIQTINYNFRFPCQESYVTYEDNLRLAGEVISVLGAFAILLLEVILWNMFHCHKYCIFIYIVYTYKSCCILTSNRSQIYWELEQNATLARQLWEAPSTSSCEYKHMWAVKYKAYCCEIPSNVPPVCVVWPSIGYACLVVLLCVFRACEVQGEAVVMAVCLVLGWCNVMFFARGFEMLGPYVIMIQKVGDHWIWTQTPTIMTNVETVACSICTCTAFWGSSIYVLRPNNPVSHFPLDYIWRPDKVHVADRHCAHWFFHLWVYSGWQEQKHSNKD